MLPSSVSLISFLELVTHVLVAWYTSASAWQRNRHEYGIDHQLLVSVQIKIIQHREPYQARKIICFLTTVMHYDSVVPATHL